MNEAETRATYIDPALKDSGWGVVDGSRIRMEFPITSGRLIGNGQRSMPSKADYVLQYKNRNIAIIEAKSDEKHYSEGTGQAKDYASRLQVRYTYSTNGLEIYEIDMLSGKEKLVDRYPTPDELWERTFKAENDWSDKLLSIPFEDKGGTWQPRYYQENAITNVIKAISAGEKRILLTLATGTGKTAIAFQIAWKLFHARWNLRLDGKRLPRILFLADRNILADQAFNSFSAFEEDALVRISPGEIRKKGKVPTNGSIFFTIFQTFMTSNNGEHYFGEYPEDYFDFIIIDECHRGGANDESNWRSIMDYFHPAVQLGLTATPKRDNNADTYRYFGEPVYIYSLKEGINDGFLTPFQIKEISTTIDKYIYTSDDVVLEGEIDESKEYTQEEMNKVIEIREREEYLVKKFLGLMNQNEKTIVFCATQLHALAVRDLINQHSDSTNPLYCQRVTADEGKLGEQYLRDFQDNEKTIPTVLTTSQKLSTGVDAPEVKNIVLIRPVNSMIEFKQIVGRGTRVYDGKDYFTIYDFVGAYKHFLDPEWDGPPTAPDPCAKCGENPCVCLPSVCRNCGETPCVCEKPPKERCEICGKVRCECDGPPKKRMVKVKLSDGKVREIDSMVKTSFYNIDGKPLSAEEFLESLFGKLPELFKSEDELRSIWSKPETRKRLLKELSDRGYPESNLHKFKSVINADDSDLYDVLAYVGFHNKPKKRIERAEAAKKDFGVYESPQRTFLDFVLEKYVESGVSELDDKKLPDLLTLKYKALADAKNSLGEISDIRNLFIDFQEKLYRS